MVLNNFKAKSPIDKTRIHNHSNSISLLNNVTNTTANHITVPSVNNIAMNNNFTSTLNNINMEQIIPTQGQNIPINKNMTNRISEALTDREKSHRNPK